MQSESAGNAPRWPARLGLLAIVALTCGYFVWTTLVSFDGAPRLAGRQSDHFNLLGRGFLKGQLSLDATPAPELRALANPYDPRQRADIPVLHDASYFRGKYYIYFGPAPVITLLVPFTVLVRQDLPLPYAVLTFALGGYLVLVAIFLHLRRRFYPETSAWVLLAALIALGGSTFLVGVLRRPHIWELSVASGFFYFALAVFCALRALDSPRAVRWAAVGGLALGLAIASRPTYVAGCVVFALPLLFRRAEERGNFGWRATLAAAASCGAIVAGLLVYNYARFGNALEFGQKYQLAGMLEEGAARHFSASYVPFNVRVYFTEALSWHVSFPHAAPINPGNYPAGYGGYEYCFGLLPNAPFAWFAVCSLVMIAGWRGRAPHNGRRCALAIVAIAAAATTGILLFYFGSCIRYMTDFAPWWLLLAACGLLEAETRLVHRWPRLALRTLALACAIFGGVACTLGVAEIYNGDRDGPPDGYRPLSRLTHRIIALTERRRFPDFGPRDIRFSLPADRAPRREILLSVAKSPARAGVVFIDYIDAASIRLGYLDTGASQPPLVSAALPAPPGATHRLRISPGGDAGEFDGFRGRLLAEFDEHPLWRSQSVSPEIFPGAITLGATAIPLPESRPFSGRIESATPTAFAALPPPPPGNVRVWFMATRALAGRPYPLATSGVHQAGDTLSLRVEADGTVRFGYDSWGRAMVLSPAMPLAFDQPHGIEFQLPVTALPGTESLLIVKLDGAIVWQERAPFYAATRGTFHPGRNPIGASTAEPAFAGADFEVGELTFRAPKK